MDEILGFMEQSNISAKNIARLKALVSIADSNFQLMRELILDIALIAPRKRRRWKILREQRIEVLQRAVDAGLIDQLDEPIEPDLDETDWMTSESDGSVHTGDESTLTDDLPVRDDIPF